MNLNTALNNAFHANCFNGFDPSVFDVEAYEAAFAGPTNEAGEMRGFDGYDVIELTEHRSPAAPGGMLDYDADEPDQYADEPWDGFNSDAEADADVLANAGMGTDEDYGYYGED